MTCDKCNKHSTIFDNVYQIFETYFIIYFYIYFINIYILLYIATNIFNYVLALMIFTRLVHFYFSSIAKRVYFSTSKLRIEAGFYSRRRKCFEFFEMISYFYTYTFATFVKALNNKNYFQPFSSRLFLYFWHDSNLFPHFDCISILPLFATNKLVLFFFFFLKEEKFPNFFNDSAFSEGNSFFPFFFTSAKCNFSSPQ